MQDVFAGTIVNFIECKEHNFESIRPENFIHLTLTVKNPQDNTDSLHLAIQVSDRFVALSPNYHYISKLKTATVSRGGSEFSLIYIKKPTEVVGIPCPRF